MPMNFSLTSFDSLSLSLYLYPPFLYLSLSCRVFLHLVAEFVVNVFTSRNGGGLKNTHERIDRFKRGKHLGCEKRGRGGGGTGGGSSRGR